MSHEISKWLVGYNLLILGIYWAYNPFTNLLLTSWDIQVAHFVWMFSIEWAKLIGSFPNIAKVIGFIQVWSD